MKRNNNSDGLIHRREILKRGTMAGAGAAIVLNNFSIRDHEVEPIRFSGLAAEYDNYDALGLAELIARRQITPQELLAKGTKVVDVPVRLGGMVAPGSVKWDAEKLDLRFQVMDGVKTVEVHSKGAPPQMFRDNMGVVCEGRFKNGVFESTNLMIKHSEEYRAPKEGQTPQEMYKEMFKTLREDAKS